MRLGWAALVFAALAALSLWPRLDVRAQVRGQERPWDGAERIASNGGGYVVLVRMEPDPIPENEEFGVTAWVFAPDALDAPLDSVALDVDAAMPEHGHGMNRVPEIARRADGGFEARGLLFHMGGRWELYLDVTRGAITERAQRAVNLE